MASILSFGAGETKTYMVVHQVNIDQTAEIATAEDETGKVIEIKAYSKSVERKYEGLLKKDSTPPTAGSVVDVDGWNALVLAVNESKSSKDFTKLSITMKTSDSANLEAL